MFWRRPLARAVPLLTALGTVAAALDGCGGGSDAAGSLFDGAGGGVGDASVASPGPGSDAGSSPEAGSPADARSASDADPRGGDAADGAAGAECPLLPFTANTSAGGHRSSGSETTYLTQKSLNGSQQMFWDIVWNDGTHATNATTGTTIDLSTQNPLTCTYCVGYQDLCTNGACNAVFYPTAGTVRFDVATRGSPGSISVTASDVIFRVWDRINETFPPGGDCYRLPAASLTYSW